MKDCVFVTEYTLKEGSKGYDYIRENKETIYDNFNYLKYEFVEGGLIAELKIPYNEIKDDEKLEVTTEHKEALKEMMLAGFDKETIMDTFSNFAAVKLGIIPNKTYTAEEIESFYE